MRIVLASFVVGSTCAAQSIVMGHDDTGGRPLGGTASHQPPTAAQKHSPPHRVWVTGRVFDRQTGRPVRAAVDYTPFLTNAFRNNYPQYRDGHARCTLGNDHTYRTDPEGRFRMPVIPGRGIIVGWCDDLGYMPGLGSETIQELRDDAKTRYQMVTQDGVVPDRLHSLRAVDIPADAMSYSVDLPVDRGLIVDFSVVDSQGRPVNDPSYEPMDGPFFGSRVKSNRVTISGLVPGRRVTLLFGDAHSRTAKSVEFTPSKGRKSFTVVLEQLAKVSGRILHHDGSPWPGVQIGVRHDIGEHPDYWAERSKTDKDGRFAIPLVSQGKYSLRAGSTVLVSHLLAPGGRQVDLGDRVIESAESN